METYRILEMSGLSAKEICGQGVEMAQEKYMFASGDRATVGKLPQFL